MAPKKAGGERPPTDVWVVILCGLPGSGKSTLRSRLVQKGWAYVSQDEMGSRDACEKALVKALKNQTSCVVDRCNVTSSERRLWMQHANRAVEKKEAKGVKLHFEAVWMAVPPEVCKERVRSRNQHETLSPENADDVIDDFCKGMRVPERSGQEPYECVQFVATEEDAHLVVQRYTNPSCIAASVKAASSSSSATQADARNVALDAAVAGNHQKPLAHDAALACAEVFVLRHGERADRAKDLDGGWVDDPPLTKDGRETAKRAGASLRSLPAAPWAVVYSSPFFRCLQTANEVAAELGVPVRIEPGLSELCIGKIFERQPRLRGAAESVQAALTRVEIDLSCPPVHAAMPVWPEEMRAANTRVLQTSRSLASRHPGEAVVLVCHSHSLVEVTRHFPESGSGATSSNPGYCALSHISPEGQLLRCLDLSFLKGADINRGGPPTDTSSVSGNDVGHWESNWNWVPGRQHESSESSACHEVDDLLSMGLDHALENFTAFKTLFERGTVDQQALWRNGWACGNADVRTRLRKALDAGVFRRGSSLPFDPARRAASTLPEKLFAGCEDRATEASDSAFYQCASPASAAAKALGQGDARAASGKYPSTPHLPFSPGVNADDILLADCQGILREEVVVTEKFDGGNCCIKEGQVYARTHAQPATHESFSAVKQLSRSFAAQLDGIELFGENMQGVHSIQYNNLTSFFYVFGARAHGRWLAWDAVVAVAESLDLPTVPVIFRGSFESPSKLQACLEAWARLPSAIGADVNPEGFVIRRTHDFPNHAFADNIAKYVRANHIQTDADWKRRWKKAQLGPALTPRGQLDVTADGCIESGGFVGGSSSGTGSAVPHETGLVASSAPTAEQSHGMPPVLQRQESHPLPPEFSQWLRAAILEELPADEGGAIIDCAEVILQGAHSDPCALDSAVEVLRDSGAPLCAAALAQKWHANDSNI